MKKAKKKDTLRLIQKTRGRFFSLSAIIAIGSAFFVGVSGSSYMMSRNVDAYMDETNLKDITIYSDYGFDEEDIGKLQEQAYVEKAEGTKFADVIGTSEGSSKVIRIHAWNPEAQINQFELREGRLPENDHEVVGEAGTDLAPGLPIGTKVRLSRPQNDLDDYLKVDEVTVVGTIDTPLYINETKETSTLSNRYITTYFYLPSDAFVQDFYTEANILVTGAKQLNVFSKDYEDLTKDAAGNLEEMGKRQAAHRYESVKKEADQKYEDGQKEYQENLQKFQDETSQAEQKLAEGKQAAAEGLQAIEENKKKLQASQAELDAAINQKQQEINDGEKQLQAGFQKLEEAQQQPSGQQKQLEEGQKQLPQLEESLSQLQKAADTYNTLNQQIDSLSQVDENTPLSLLIGQNPAIEPLMNQAGLAETNTVSDLKAALNTMKSGILIQAGFSSIDELNGMIATLQSQKQAVENGNQQIREAQAQLQETSQTLNQKKTELEAGAGALEEAETNGQNQIDAGWAEIRKNEAVLMDKQAEIEQGEKDLAQAKADGQEKLDQAAEDLAEAKEKIADLKENKWTVLDHEKHYGSETYRNTVDQMAAIGNIFPVFFFMVACLVCLTTMTRMIDEERGQIGIFRALGYTRYQCISKYLIYASSATVLGLVIGSITGILTFPVIIYQAWRMLYIEPPMKIYIPWHLIALASVSFMAVMILTTLYVSYSDMKDVPAQLMRPKAPKHGSSNFLEHIPWLWNKVTFSWKVTIRNLLRYKKRVFMTLIGVAGCSALMVTGFGIRDSINQMVKLQFDEIMKIDGMVTYKEDITEDQLQQEKQDLLKNEDIVQVNQAASFSSKTAKDGNDKTVILQVFDDNEEAQQIYQLRTMKKHKPLELTDEGIIISQKLSEDLNIKTGDTVTIEDKDGDQKEAEVSGIAEMYIQHYVFMTRQYYQEVFGKESRPDTLMIQMKDGVSTKDLQQQLSEDSEVESINFYEKTLENFRTMVRSLDFIVAVLIISSLALSFVVLGNLMNINIAERQREIATLKVLGFYEKEVQNYIYKENNILTFFGALLGIPLGIRLHHWIMREVEFSYVMYGREVMPLSIVISVALTIGFGLIVNQVMRKKLRNIEMVESLKSVE